MEILFRKVRNSN